MKVAADLNACQGYVCCVMAAPEVFDVDEGSAKVIVLQEAPADSLRPKVEEAVRACPSGALAIVDD